MSDPIPTLSPSPAPQKINTRAAGVVGLAVMCSRVLGLAREQIFLHIFGAGLGMDAFVMAFRIPNLLRDLFAEGALSTAFVTTFSKRIKAEGDQSAWALANKVATLATIVLSLLTIAGIIFAPQLVEVLAYGSSPEKKLLTIELTRIMFPFILMVSLAALVMGMLNSKGVFGVPAMASSFFNLGSIVGGIAFGWWMDPQFGERALLGLAMGTLLGGTLQFLVQVPALRRVGYRFRPDLAWRDEGVRTVLRLMGPAVIAASAVQVNVMVNGMFASSLGNGPISWLNASFRLMQLPLGVFGVAIGTVTLPLISRSVAAGNALEFRSILAKGMRLAFVLTVPAAIGLILLARPIVSLLYEHGRFTALSTEQTAAALQCYALGLVAYSGIKVLAPAFYAIDKRKTPMMVSFAAIGSNFCLNWLFTLKLNMGHRGLALSTGCVALMNFVALYVLMRRETKLLETRLMAVTLVKVLVAGIPLAALCWISQRTLMRNWADLAFVFKAIYLLGTIAAGGGAFFGAAILLRIDGLEEVTALLHGKLRRFSRR